MDEPREFDEMVIRRVDQGLQIEYRQQGQIITIATYPALLDMGERVTVSNVRGALSSLAHKTT